MIHHEYVERIVDLLDPSDNQIFGQSVNEAKRCLLESPASAGRIAGSFALVANSGKTVRMARSLDQIGRAHV